MQKYASCAILHAGNLCCLPKSNFWKRNGKHIPNQKCNERETNTNWYEICNFSNRFSNSSFPNVAFLALKKFLPLHSTDGIKKTPKSITTLTVLMAEIRFDVVWQLKLNGPSKTNSERRTKYTHKLTGGSKQRQRKMGLLRNSKPFRAEDPV